MAIYKKVTGLAETMEAHRVHQYDMTTSKSFKVCLILSNFNSLQIGSQFRS